MLFKATVSFFYKETNTLQQDPWYRGFEYRCMEMHKLSYSVDKTRHVQNHFPLPDETVMERTYHIEREIKHNFAAIYLSMIIQGEAGMMKLLPYVLSVDVSFF